jgi:hypothetical protein
MADGNRLNLKSIEYLRLTFGLWHWDLNMKSIAARCCLSIAFSHKISEKTESRQPTKFQQHRFPNRLDERSRQAQEQTTTPKGVAFI